MDQDIDSTLRSRRPKFTLPRIDLIPDIIVDLLRNQSEEGTVPGFLQTDEQRCHRRRDFRRNACRCSRNDPQTVVSSGFPRPFQARCVLKLRCRSRTHSCQRMARSGGLSSGSDWSSALSARPPGEPAESSRYAPARCTRATPRHRARTPPRGRDPIGPPAPSRRTQPVEHSPGSSRRTSLPSQRYWSSPARGYVASPHSRRRALPRQGVSAGPRRRRDRRWPVRPLLRARRGTADRGRTGRCRTPRQPGRRSSPARRRGARRPAPSPR